MKRSAAWASLIIILCVAALLRQYRLLDFPLHGDEVDEGDIAREMLGGNLALFYPQNEGNEPLFQLTMAPFFAILGNSLIANRFPSMAWSIIFVALMYTYGRILFRSRRMGVMAAGLAAILWMPTVFGRLGLREISQPVMMIPALIGLVITSRDSSGKRTRRAAIIGGIFAGLTSYTFLSGRGFLAVIILFLLYFTIVQREQVARRRGHLFLNFAITLALTIPLFAYLQINPGLDYHVQDLASRSLLMQGSLERLARHTVDTLGMFTLRGDQNWVRNIPGRPIFPGIEGWLFYFGVGLCIWRWRKPEFVLQLIVVATFLLPNILAEDPPRWTRSIGILPGLIVLPVLPIEWAWTQLSQAITNIPKQNLAKATSVMLVGLLGISILARTATDMFSIWIDDPGIYWMTLAFYDGAGKYVNRSSDTTPFNYVLDVYEPWRKSNIERAAQRDDVAMRYSQSSAFVFPNDPRGARIAFQILGAPALPLINAFLDLNLPIYLDPRVEPEGRRLLQVFFVPRARLDKHLAVASTGVVVSPETNLPITTPVRVSDLMEFEGYEILNPQVRAGDELDVLTYWHMLKRPPNVAVFVHLIDMNRQVVTQFDGFEPIIDELTPGDTVVQLHTLPLPDNLPANDYRFEMGVYTRDDLKRLPLNIGTDYVWLQELSVR